MNYCVRVKLTVSKMPKRVLVCAKGQIMLYNDNVHIDNHSHATLPEDVSFDATVLRYKLDFKRCVAFQIMASLFVLKSLQNEKVTSDNMCSLFARDDK